MYSKLKTLGEQSFLPKVAVIRLDFNMPQKDGKLLDSSRLERHIPTLRFLQEQGVTLVLLSHFGRPGGRPVPEMSLSPMVPHLHAVLDKPVTFVPTLWTDNLAHEAVAQAPAGSILLMENTRFHPGEEKNDPELAKSMARLGDLYINDAFSVSHRAHASTEGITHHLPSCAGYALETEIRTLSSILESPQRPLAVVVGGAKISTKLDLLSRLLTQADLLIVGGAMANTLLAAQGCPVGASLCEWDQIDTAQEILRLANASKCTLFLPMDACVAQHCTPHAQSRNVDLHSVLPEDKILDLGSQSIAELLSRLLTVRSLIWNGPLGAFEVPPFDHATTLVASEVARLTRAGRLTSVAGGGDTVSALRHAGVCEAFSYVSMGGGAFLEWFEGKSLPGILPLLHNPSS